MNSEAGLNKIELADDLLLQSEDFKKTVAIPYFKDIFKDLLSQQDAKEQKKGLSQISCQLVSSYLN